MLNKKNIAPILLLSWRTLYSARSEYCREGLPVRKHVVTTERMAMKRDVARVRWSVELGPVHVLCLFVLRPLHDLHYCLMDPRFRLNSFRLASHWGTNPPVSDWNTVFDLLLFAWITLL